MDRSKNDYWDYLEHAGVKGMTWKKHKYLKNKNGEYIYDNSSLVSRTSGATASIINAKKANEASDKVKTGVKNAVDKTVTAVKDKIADNKEKNDATRVLVTKNSKKATGDSSSADVHKKVLSRTETKKGPFTEVSTIYEWDSTPLNNGKKTDSRIENAKKEKEESKVVSETLVADPIVYNVKTGKTTLNFSAYANMASFDEIENSNYTKAEKQIARLYKEKQYLEDNRDSVEDQLDSGANMIEYVTDYYKNPPVVSKVSRETAEEWLKSDNRFLRTIKQELRVEERAYNKQNK